MLGRREPVHRRPKSASRSFLLASRSTGVTSGALHEGQAPPASMHALHSHTPHVCLSTPGPWWVSHFAAVDSAGFAGALGGVGFRALASASSSRPVSSSSSVLSFLEGTTWASASVFFAFGSAGASSVFFSPHPPRTLTDPWTSLA